MGCFLSKCSSRKKLVQRPVQQTPRPPVVKQVKTKRAMDLVLPALREEERKTQERNLIRQKDELEKVLHEINSVLRK